MKKNAPISSLLLALFLIGCSEQTITESITNPNHKPEVPIVETITSDMIVIHTKDDGMDRGNHDFFDKDVVVDTKYYQNNPIVRGEMIAVKEKDGYHRVIRVIALAGEKVKVEKGQFYINGKKLDTFYGKAHRMGLDLEKLKKMLEEGNYGALESRQNVENNVNGFENTNIEEITVPESNVYVTGDDWGRSQYMGVLETEKIAGKVLGYK